MIPFISLPAKIIRLLESNVSPAEIAGGVCLGMFIGFTPFNGPMMIVLIGLFLILKFNRLSTLITLPIFKLFYVLGISSFTNTLGEYALINAEYLTYFWRFITSLPVIAYFGLNNTLVAGGLLLSAILSIPVFFVSKKLAFEIKSRYGEKIKNIKFFKWVKSLPIVSHLLKAINKLKSMG
ncbi:MAG: TIGR03546 family protein [Candidatus Omnitrophica bacterium]|nr:TIGR03546 family protein [Candidatus Omnitrophota bacterium]